MTPSKLKCELEQSDGKKYATPIKFVRNCLILALSVLFGLLAIWIVPEYLDLIDHGRGHQRNNTQIKLDSAKTPLDLYRLHIGNYPSTTEGLDALVRPPNSLKSPAKWQGPYISEEETWIDSWDRPIIYISDGETYTLPHSGLTAGMARRMTLLRKGESDD